MRTIWALRPAFRASTRMAPVPLLHLDADGRAVVSYNGVAEAVAARRETAELAGAIPVTSPRA